MDWVFSGAGLPAYHYGQVKWKVPDKFQENCSKANTPFVNFCLLALAQLYILQGISDGVSMGGTPGGRHFGLPPGLVPSPGEMRSPRQISGWWLVWVRRQAAGHTHTHTHFHLYIGDVLGLIKFTIQLCLNMNEIASSVQVRKELNICCFQFATMNKLKLHK